jgi:hypothetical protein
MRWRISVTIAALASLIPAAFTDPSRFAQPSFDSRSATPRACPAIRALGDKRLVFDAARLAGGPDYVNDHTLILGADNRWHLFGIFHEEPFNSAIEREFVHAISDVRDPREWDASSFHLSPFAGGVALSFRPDLGETHLWAPHVVRSGDRYIMVYQSGGPVDRAQIRMAESTDLTRWTRVGDAPLFEDVCVARDPMLRRHGELWTLYYTRCKRAGDRRSGVAYRTSTDLRSWSAPAMALTLESAPARFDSGYTESPFVFERGGWYYLTVTAYPVGYDATFVYCSRSPFHFSEPPTARLAAHAAEWIFTDSGEAFMTHCGPGQGGVWVAPMAIPSGA